MVTGGAGFIGSTLVAALLRRGDEVVVVDALTPYYDPALKRAALESVAGPGLTVVEADLNTLDLAPVLDGADAVVHLAGQPGVRKSWGDDFVAYTRANVDATQRVLESIVRTSPGTRFLYASSSSVYGQAETYPTHEEMLPRPLSPYGVTKLAGEHLTGLYAESFGVQTAAFRFFTVYGPRQRPDMAFTRFLGAARDGSPITVYGTGEQIRDFTFVGDIVEALIAGLDATSALPRVMNLSGGSSVSVNEVLETIAAVTGRRLDVQRLDPVRGDVFRTGGDSTRAREALGWEPEVTLEEGLRRQWEWIRSL
ncbi:NAD-dependent epimerase/dehydratase family protein [Leifsonia sp. NPDC056824]|uniref:NAD-dependent epimerase/dehydratase family protein n=1 Tax=Leifsonia sp. NPDC056824 TaxID=3345953 RepID=UPI00368F0A11